MASDSVCGAYRERPAGATVRYRQCYDPTEMTATPPVPPEPRRVASLLGHRHVEMAVLCLGSLLRGAAEPLALRLHDDGSLTGEDRERLAAALGEPEVVPRSEADERVVDVLSGRPALAAFRRSNPLALKLVDAVLYARDEAGTELAYCDTDVLFLRPFAGLFPPGAGAVSATATATFMADHQNAYSVRSWHLARYLVRGRLRLARRVNSGVIQFPTAAWDPDLLEWYLGRPEFGFAPVWAEQTAWALLGAAAGCRLFDPRQIAIPTVGPPDELDKRVALHFVNPVRALLPLWESRAVRAGDGRPPVAIERVPAGRCGPLGLAADEVRRRLARLR
jgi:hypothetical protein